MRMSGALFLFSIIVLNISCARKAEWVTTTATEQWVSQVPLSSLKASGSSDVMIDTSKTDQSIGGFGACFNELGWISLNRLNPQDLNEVMSELFLPGKGANFTLCRMPVGANDFSRDWYSYDEADGDFALNSFSIANDRETLIPFILEAKKYNPDLKLWASPWSPPTWMKWNRHYACAVPRENLAEQFRNGLTPDKQGREGTNMFIQEDKYFSAYARYFARFIESYRQEGIQISMIMPQNEFNSCQIFPSCTWKVSGLTEFVGKYLGPEMDKLGVDIFFGTMERPAEAMVDTILTDPVAGKYIKGAGFQWAGKKCIPGIHARYPELTLYQTEQECGNGKNDWKYCTYTWTLMKHYLSNGASAYLYWNISLDKGGYSRWGWQQNSLVTIDPETSSYKLNYEYYLMKHLSHYVKPGAKRIIPSGNYDNMLAFLNPDKSVVCLIRNEESSPKEVSITCNGRMIKPMLPGDSFSTIVLK